MNTRLLCGLIVVTTLGSGVLGCNSPTKRNGGLYSGGNSSLTEATNNTLRNVDNSQGGALGGLQIADKPSAAERLLSPLKSVGQSLTPQSIPDSTQDPLSLNNKPNAPTPDLFLSAARVVAGGGNIENARSLYEQALVADPTDRDALLELARLEIEADDFEKATERYMQAVEAHPNDPVVYNDLGLFHAHREGWELSIKAFERAIELDGEKTLYRNNLAHTWVKVGQPQEALVQLAAVHPKPDAHFNLGYLLYTQKQLLPALEQFELAYQADNQLHDAIEMRNRVLDELQRRQPQNGPRQVVRPASYLQTSSDDSNDDPTEVAQSNESEASTNGEPTEESTRNEESLVRVQTPTQVAQEIKEHDETPAPQSVAKEEDSGPRVIVLDGNSDDDLVVRANRHTRLTDIAIDEEPPVASQPASSNDANLEPPILDPEFAGQPIREVPQPNHALPNVPDADDQNAPHSETFAKYEKYWMPLSFYVAIEKSKSEVDEDSANAPVEPNEYVSTTLGEGTTGATETPINAQPPALLPSGADESKPLRTTTDAPLFDKRQSAGTYYPTTGAPAIVPK